MSDAWTYVLSDRAERDIVRLAPQVRRQIIESLDRLIASDETPFGRGRLVRLKGQRGLSRLRVGDWRVIVQLNYKECRLVVVRVQHRSAVYDRM